MTRDDRPEIESFKELRDMEMVRKAEEGYVTEEDIARRIANELGEDFNIAEINQSGGVVHVKYENGQKYVVAVAKL